MASQKRAHETDDECDEITVNEPQVTPGKGKKRVLQKYRSVYHEKYNCLVPSRKGDGYVHCTLCLSDFSCQHGGLFDCTRHVSSASHKQFESSAKKQPGLSSFFQRKDSTMYLEKATMKAEAMLCDVIADANLPLSTADKLNQTVKVMFPDSKIAQNMKCCRNKATAVIKEMSAMHMSHLATRMQHQPFSIATDGSNDIDKKQFPIVVRIQDSAGTVNTELLAVRVCEGAATGQNIFNLMDDEFSAQQIPWRNCISFGCDNANVMTGRKKGVISFVRRETQEVHMSGCCLHLVHIAAKTGAKCLPPVEDILVDIFHYFKKSVNRQTELKELQSLYELDQQKMLKHVCTRWLSIQRCLDRLLTNWIPLLHFFREEKKKTESNSCKKEESSSYAASKVETIYSFLRSPTNHLMCKFLAYTLHVYDKVLKGLQAEEPMIHNLRPALVQLLQDLYSRFLKPSAVAGKQVEEVEYSLQENHKDNEDILIGSAASDMIKDSAAHNLRSSRIQDFYKAVKSYFQEVCTYLLNKLPLDDPVLQRIGVIDPTNQLTAKAGDLRYFLDRFPVLIPREETKDTVLEQFTRYQVADITSCLKERLDHTWAEIARVHEVPLLGRVVAGIMTIPHSSAPCERVFSMVRKNTTDQRASLTGTTMEALLVVKSKPGDYLDDSRQFSNEQLDVLKSAYYNSLKNN